MLSGILKSQKGYSLAGSLMVILITAIVATTVLFTYLSLRQKNVATRALMSAAKKQEDYRHVHDVYATSTEELSTLGYEEPSNVEIRIWGEEESFCMTAQVKENEGVVYRYNSALDIPGPEPIVNPNDC